jgi:hypothetical protein
LSVVTIETLSLSIPWRLSAELDWLGCWFCLWMDRYTNLAACG